MNTTHTALIEALVKSRALINLPENFTTRTYARAMNGSATSVHSATATCFCLLGSVMRTTGYDYDSFDRGLPYKLYFEARSCLDKQLQTIRRTYSLNPQHCIAEYSDTSSHADVLSLLDATISRLKADTVQSEIH